MRKELIQRIISIAIIVLFIGVILFCVYYYNRYYAKPEEAGQDNSVMIEDGTQTEEEKQQEASGAEEEKTEEYSYDFEGYLDISAAVASEAGTRNIKLYIQQDMCYFFLPSYAAAGQAVWQFDEEKYGITLDGQKIKSGDALAWEEKQLICISRMPDEQSVEYKLNVMKSEVIPAMYIDTDSQAMTYLEQDKEHEETGSFQCIGDAGEIDSEGKLSKISGRGYSSFNAKKKSYTITTQEEQNVLGMGSAYKWVLQANAYDLTRMRNKIAYDMAKDIGVPYAVDSGYVDVYFNGEYAGNYLLCEKIEAAHNRVDIGDAYLLEAIFASRSEEEIDFIQGNAGWYEVKNPEEITEEDLEFLKTYMDHIVEVIEGCETEEEYQQLQQYIDIDSFAQMYILDELTNEPDLNRASTFYFILDEGASRKLYAGPVWDYDRSMGNVEGAKYEYLTCLSPGLGEKLFECEYFRRDVTERFSAQYETVIAYYLEHAVADYVEMIRASIEMDEIRWGSSKNNTYMNFNAQYTTFDDAVRYLMYYLDTRYQLIQGYLYEPDQYHQIEFVNSGSRQEYDSRRYWLKDGEKVPEEVMMYLQEIFSCDGWAYEDGRHCQINRPVFTDMKVYSYVDESESAEIEPEPEAMEPESSGYSKRFVLFCMFVSAIGAGVCGIVLGWLVQIIRYKRKEKSREQ